MKRESFKKPVLWSAAEAAEATGGRTAGPWAATGVCIDIETVRRGDLFIALNGPEEIIAAIRKGAAAVVAESRPKNAPQNLPLLFVKDAAAALYDLGVAARLRSGACIAATSGPDSALAGAMLGAAFAACGQTHAQGHEVPVSLPSMQAGTDYAVFEIAGQTPHEEAFWSWHVRPHIVLVTGGRPEILEGLAPGGVLILNRDDADYAYMRSVALAQGITRLYTVGATDDAHGALGACLNADNGVRAEGRIMGEPVSLSLQGGRRAALLAMAALLAVRIAGADMKKAASALQKQIWEQAERDDNVVLLENRPEVSEANRRAAFRVLALIDPGRGKRRIAVLRDAPELLQTGNDAICDLSLPLRADDVHLLYTNAPFAATKPGRRHEMGEIVPDVLGPGDVLMVDGAPGKVQATALRTVMPAAAGKGGKKEHAL